MNAQTVSRVLRSGGLRPIATSDRGRREGVSVSGQFVRVDVDSDRLARELSADVLAILTAAGFTPIRISDRIIRWAGL